MSGKRKRKEWDPKDVDNAFADILDEVLSLVCNKNIGQSNCIQCNPCEMWAHPSHFHSNSDMQSYLS